MPKYRALVEIHYLNNQGQQKVATPGTDTEVVTDFADATIQSGWLVTQGFALELPDDWQAEPQAEPQPEPQSDAEPVSPDADTTPPDEEEAQLPSSQEEGNA